ncbi:Mss4-like protein [Papiliotrema laurentii]|uniref:Mss4-like protein n=1 Tax=Papiliotrema laurentii TaxID=5418 RepID=A0AAD9FR09_PAPLA|nr:Mss4-like protein [Papiliotrema laurentii]
MSVKVTGSRGTYLDMPLWELQGSANGITTKIPKSAFTLTQGTLKIHQGDNGSGSRLTREFCGECGSGILEYGESAGDNIYVFYGTQDDLDVLPPKGEFFCSQRCSWLPEVPGVFHKQKIKE